MLDWYEPKLKSSNDIHCRPLLQNLIQIHWAFSEMKYHNLINTIHFMNFVQKQYNF